MCLGVAVRSACPRCGTPGAMPLGSRRRRLRCQASPSVCWSIIWIITAQKRYGLGCLVFAQFVELALRAHNRTGQTTAPALTQNISAPLLPAGQGSGEVLTSAR